MTAGTEQVEGGGATARAMRDAKEDHGLPSSVLGRPLHPTVAALATGAWVCSLGFDLVSQVANDPDIYTRGAYFLVLAGIGFGLVAGVIGVFDVLPLPRGSEVFRTGVRHLVASDVTVLVFLASFLGRRHLSFVETPWSLVALSVLALGFLAAATVTGLDLTYRWGVRVAGDEAQAAGYEADGDAATR